MDINGETKIIGFFGSTYKTSKMYAVYNASFAALGLNFVYIPFVVADIAKAVAAIRHLGIQAVGVTIPYKMAIVPFLDELDEDAKRIGAVNVVVNKNGRLIGGNTDGKGAVMALKEKTEVKNKNIVLLGVGGVARAIVFAIKDEGGELTILSRTIAKAKDLASVVGCPFGSLEKLEKAMQKADILIQATSVGMTPEINQSLVPRELLHTHLTVQEVVSHPRETKLLNEAKKIGCQLVYGERMLLWQAILKFKIYTGVEPPVEIMEKAIRSVG